MTEQEKLTFRNPGILLTLLAFSTYSWSKALLEERHLLLYWVVAVIATSAMLIIALNRANHDADEPTWASFKTQVSFEASWDNLVRIAFLFVGTGLATIAVLNAAYSLYFFYLHVAGESGISWRFGLTSLAGAFVYAAALGVVSGSISRSSPWVVSLLVGGFIAVSMIVFMPSSF